MLKEVVAVFPVSGSKNLGGFQIAQALPLTPRAPRPLSLLYATSSPPPPAAPAHAPAPAAIWEPPGGAAGGCAPPGPWVISATSAQMPWGHQGSSYMA